MFEKAADRAISELQGAFARPNRARMQQGTASIDAEIDNLV
jgi:hypothetical protein